MRFAFKAVAALVGLLALGVAAWAVFAQPNVTVSIVNASEKPIAWVRVLDEKAAYDLKGIAIGESRVFEFRPHGETTYSLVVGFEDGSELRSEAVYTEAGYVFTATISDSSISNRFERFKYL